MTLPPALEALKLDALRTSCEAWAIRARWQLAPGIDRAGPCPRCGGKDRFAIHTVKNLFSCRKCEIAGEGVIDLVMKTQGVSFTRACEIITGRSADVEPDPAELERRQREAELEKAERDRDAAERREKARKDGYRLWKGAARAPWHMGNPVRDYLEKRGLDVPRILSHAPGALASIRQSNMLGWVEKQGDQFVRLAEAPAMIAGIQLPDGHFAGAHRTWIDLAQPNGRLVLPDDEKGRPRATKKVLGTQKGGAIRLYTPRGARRIVGGEGIETTLSVLCHAFESDTAYWAFVNLGNMHGRFARAPDGKYLFDEPDMTDLDGFLPPEWCEELVYLSDPESEGTRVRQKLVIGLKRAMRLRPGLRGRIVPAPDDDLDFNDLAMQMAAAERIER